MNKKAFTFVEILIVVAIIGVLGVGVTAALNNMIDSSNTKRCQSNRASIEMAKSAFHRDHPAATTATAAQLLPYMRGQSALPTCPNGGVYTTTSDIDIVTSCTIHGNGL